VADALQALSGVRVRGSEPQQFPQTWDTCDESCATHARNEFGARPSGARTSEGVTTRL
jgi:hypothetical protein